MSDLKVGDEIRIHDDARCNEVLRGELAEVDEVRPWGCVAFIDTHDGTFYVRLTTGDFTPTGENSA